MAVFSRKNNISVDEIQPSEYWSTIDGASLDMHRIHWYPAKFPPVLVQKSINYLKEDGVNIKTVADCFCGCGTTSLETKRLGYNFWGCDINPVATLITRVKTNNYNYKRLQEYYNKILHRFDTDKKVDVSYYLNNERISYWFFEDQIKDLSVLLHSINSEISNEKYLDFFHCAFSNILRPCSKWLMKSIKPQVDPAKVPADVKNAFENQVDMMLKALKKRGDLPDTKCEIETKNLLTLEDLNPFVDILVTSPPYVTSYEYADLHQLSSLWLGYVKDYRDLRTGTIGSRHKAFDIPDIKLNKTGKGILDAMSKAQKSRVKEINRYFQDMERFIEKAYSIINPGGGIVIVIGNTKYNGVYVDNTKFLAECMLDCGFKKINIEKREIKNKILTSYRDKKGKFSSNPNGQQVYSVEFVITARK